MRSYFDDFAAKAKPATAMIRRLEERMVMSKILVLDRMVFLNSK